MWGTGAAPVPGGFNVLRRILSDRQDDLLKAERKRLGDLRVAHFFATHAMHFLPLAGLGCAALLSPLAARRAVQVAAGLLVAVTLATFVQALAGLPLLPVF